LSHRNDEVWKRIALLRFWQLPASRRKRKRRWAEIDLKGLLELVVYSWGKQKKDEGVWGPLDEAGVMELNATELLV
jgi:hypothetical protein